MSREKTKSRHMTDETFAELITSAKQALAYERGEDSGHRVTRIAVPPSVRPMSSAAYEGVSDLAIGREAGKLHDKSSAIDFRSKRQYKRVVNPVLASRASHL
jgi:hypothetical protein